MKLTPVQVIPHATLAKAKAFFDRGGVVVGYGFLPSKSATIGKSNADIVALCDAIWGGNAKPGATVCKTNAAGGRSYMISQVPTPQEITAVLADDAGVRPTLQVLEGQTDDWLHVLHRQKMGKEIFLVCNQNHEGAARRFKFRATAQGEPECWDAMRNEITALPYRRIDVNSVEFTLTMEPLESTLIVFQPKPIARPMLIGPDTKQIRKPIVLVRDPNPASSGSPAAKLKSLGGDRPLTINPKAVSDPFRGRFTIAADVKSAKYRVYLEMDGLPESEAAVSVNGRPAGGVIGKPWRLEITRHLKSGENMIQIEPQAPKTARLIFYASDKR